MQLERFFMNRRNLIKSILASGIAIPLLGAAKSFENTSTKAITPNALQLKFGDLELYIFSDGANILKEPFPLIAPKQTEAEFNKAKTETFLDQQPIAFSLNIILIKKGNQYILFDTGNGLGKNENVGKLLEQMQASNIEPNFVTDIVLTHAHGDHINGIILPDESFAFKNAKYYIGKKEFDFWMKSDNASTINILNKIQTNLTFLKQGDVLFETIKVIETPGHTPGQLAFEITQKDKKLKLKHIADVVHSPILVRYPEYGIKYDNDFDLAVKTRKAVLEEAYLQRQLLLTMHMPWPGLGYIDKKENRYQWIPLAFASNLKQIEL